MEFITTREAARLLKRSPQAVRNLADRGILTAYDRPKNGRMKPGINRLGHLFDSRQIESYAASDAILKDCPFTNWKLDDREYVKLHYAEEGPTAIGRKIGRSPQAVQSLAVRLGLKRNANSYPYHWNEDDDETLRRDYHDEGAAAVAKILGRSVIAVHRRAQKLGIAGKSNAHGCVRVRSKRSDDPDGPTTAQPGSEARMRVYSRRLSLGYLMCHPGDVTFLNMPD